MLKKLIIWDIWDYTRLYLWNTIHISIEKMTGSCVMIKFASWTKSRFLTPPMPSHPRLRLHIIAYPYKASITVTSIIEFFIVISPSLCRSLQVVEDRSWRKMTTSVIGGTISDHSISTISLYMPPCVILIKIYSFGSIGAQHHSLGVLWVSDLAPMFSREGWVRALLKMSNHTTLIYHNVNRVSLRRCQLTNWQKKHTS